MWNILRHLTQKAHNLTLGNLAKLASLNSPLQFCQPQSLIIIPQNSLSTCGSGAISSSTTNTGFAIANSSPTFLTSPSPMFGGLVIVPSRGMKIKGRVKRRCKDCYLIWIEGILHNRCKAHPRHTQMLKPMYWANSRLLTHASSSPKRPW